MLCQVPLQQIPTIGTIGDIFITPFVSPTPLVNPDIYTWIDRHNAIAQFNHPGREETMFNNFAYNSNVADNFCAVETGNWGDGNALCQVPLQQMPTIGANADYRLGVQPGLFMKRRRRKKRR